MATAFHIATGLDGKPSIWPAAAISKDVNGVFRDIRGRVVGRGNKRTAIGKDAASTNPVVGSLEWFKWASESEIGAFFEKRLAKAADEQVQELFPAICLQMAIDNAEEEQAVREGASTEEDEYEEASADDEEEITIADRLAASYKSAKDYWQRVNRRLRQRSQFAGSTGRYPTATDGNNSKPAKRVDLIAANAKAAKQYSGFARSGCERY